MYDWNAFGTAWIYIKCWWTIYKRSKKEHKKIKKAGDSRYIYQNELDKACFQHDMAYGDLEDLTRRTASDKILRDKAFNIVQNSKYDGYQRDLVSMVYNFFDKKTCESSIKNFQKVSNEELAEELHKPIKKITLTLYRQYMGLWSCWYAINEQIL